MTNKENEKEDAEEKEVETPVSFFSFGARSSGNGDGEETVPLWLVTFTDIMALMLTFFVLLYSMSVPLEEKWEELTTGLSKGVSQSQGPKYSRGAQDAIDISRLSQSRALNLNYLESLVTELIADNERLENIVIIPQKQRLIISLPSELLFESGQSEVGAEGKRALFALGGPLSRIRNRIEIIGHADPRPVENEGGSFSSNWELSLARAAQVAAVLRDVGYERGAVVRGLSSARYDQLSEDMPQEERLNLSRRVDIVIMQDDGTKKTPF